MTQLEPPPITIADPSGATRPSAAAPPNPVASPARRLCYIALLLLAVGVVVLSRQAGTDRAALGASVAVTSTIASGSDADPNASVSIRIQNTGPERLRLLSAALDVPGWVATPSSRAELDPQQDAAITFSHRWDCERKDRPPSKVLVRVRTLDASQRVLEERLADATSTLEGLRQGTCGQLDASAALDLVHTSAALQTRPAAGSKRAVTVLLIDLEIVNRSTTALTVRRAGIQGLDTEQPAEPLALPPRSPGSPAGPPQPVHLRLSLRATSCPVPTPVDHVDLQLDRGLQAAPVDGLRELIQVLGSATCAPP